MSLPAEDKFMQTNRRYRPKVDLPLTPVEMFLNIGTFLALIALLGITLWGFLTVPDTIPTHFNLQGQPNNYGGKGTFLLLPFVGIMLFILLQVVGRYPHTYNFPWPITEENAARQYQIARTLIYWLNFLFGCMFLFIQWQAIQAAISGELPDSFVFVVIGVVVLVFLSIAIYIVTASRAR
jgi:uncharacterized membrane protein